MLDCVGGRSQSEAGRKQSEIPEKHFEEDHLHLLRAIRFAARLGFSIESGTFSAIQRVAARFKERMRDELVRILSEGRPRRGLDSSGLLAHVAPEIKACQEIQQPPKAIGRGRLTHMMLMLKGMRNPVPSLRTGSLVP